MIASSVAPSGWVLVVQRLREEKRPGEGFKRTVGTYAVLHDGVPVPGLSGSTVERQGPGDNGSTGKTQHRCIEAGSYPINVHDTGNYSTNNFKTNGRHPRPALEIGATGKREGILVHPADGYGSTIGCINLAAHLDDASDNIDLPDSTRRVIDVISDLSRFHGGALPAGDGQPVANALLLVRDASDAALATTTRTIRLDAAALRDESAVIDCDVVIQAGHEGTPDGHTGGTGPLGNEIDWTPVIANEAVRMLRSAGINAIKETARIKVTKQKYRCKLALFLHFDDPGNSSEAGPSVGYSHDSDAPAAKAWKDLYREYFPFNETWRGDNVTPDEHHYYGFTYTATSDGEFVIEFGDLHAERQARWLRPRLTWLGGLVAYYVSHRIGQGNIARPQPYVAVRLTSDVVGVPQPSGPPQPFSTAPSPAGNENGSSTTSGLRGTKQAYADGSVVIEATEALRAERTGGWHGILSAWQRRVTRNGRTDIEQRNYSYRNRMLPKALLIEGVTGLSAELPPGFIATEIVAAVASQFGKADHQDEGTGSPAMGLVQTNSEVFGASVKQSIMRAVFGANWQSDDRRFVALIEVLHPQRRRLVRLPLVDIGPRETVTASVDLTWAADLFLGTQGQADVQYRLLVPTS